MLNDVEQDDLAEVHGFHIKKPRKQRRPPVGGKWSIEEDNKLREIILEHGAKNWKKVFIQKYDLIYKLMCQTHFFTGYVVPSRLLNYTDQLGLTCNVYIDGIKC